MSKEIMNSFMEFIAPDNSSLRYSEANLITLSLIID